MSNMITSLLQYNTQRTQVKGSNFTMEYTITWLSISSFELYYKKIRTKKRSRHRSDHLNQNQMIIFFNNILDISSRLMPRCDTYFWVFLF